MDAVRKLVRGLALEHDIDEASLGRSLLYSRQRFTRIMTSGERAGLRLSDLAVLSERLGPNDQLLEAFARERGYQMVRDASPAEGPTSIDALSAATGALEEMAGIVRRLAEMSQRSALPSDGAALCDGLARVDRALARVRLEASGRTPDISPAKGGR